MVSLPPEITGELFFDGAWNSISRDTRQTAPVTITRGRSAEGKRTDPGEASAVIDNRSGAYSPRNPGSELFEKIGRNTPIRLSVDAGSPWVHLPGGGDDAITTPDDAQLAVTGDLDLRVDMALDTWRSTQELAARYQTSGDNRAWALDINSSGAVLFLWSPDGTFASRISVTSTAAVPAYSGQRIALRVTLDVDNGASGNTTTFYYARTLDQDDWQQLGDPVITSGTTSVFDGAAQLEFGSSTGLADPGASGRAYGLQLRDGIDGTLAVDLDTSVAGVGATSFTDDSGLVWSVRDNASLTNTHVRMVGEVPAWPPSRDLSGNNVYVSIAPAGIMRRLDAGNKPLDSALLRFIKATGPIECWPLTDGDQATVANSLVGGSAMVPKIDTGTAALGWSEGTLAGWIEPVALIPAETDGTILGYVPDNAGAATGWSVDFFRSGIGADEDLTIADRGELTDADPRIGWTLGFDAGSDEVTLFGVTASESSSSASLLSTISTAGIFTDAPHHIRLTITPGASDSDWELFLDGVSRDSGTYGVVSKAVRSVRAGWFLAAVTDDTPSIGYVTYWGPAAPDAADVYDALTGFPGERAGARVLRVAAEQGVTASAAGIADEDTRLGVQSREKFLDVLDTAATADLGFVLEQRDERALVYRGHATLYNQSPTITLDYSGGVISAPFKPVDDDKLTENDVTVHRDGGERGVAVLEEGRMSVLDPPDGVGRYDVEHTLSLEDNEQPAQHANWRLHLGTFDGLRYTKLVLDLANPRVHAMIDNILRADVGDKIRITDLPDDLPPDDVDLIIQGYSEEMGPDAWKITFNCTPGEPWTVAVVDDARADTDGTTLNGSMDSTTSVMNILTQVDSARWVDSATYPDDFPFDVIVGGEVMRVNSIAGTALSQAGSVTRSINGVVKSHASGADVRLAQPTTVAL